MGMKAMGQTRFFGSTAFAALLIFFSAGIGLAQEASDEFPDIPPPMRVASKEESDRLSSASDPKARTRLALEFMEARLKLAEQALSQTNFALVHRELGGFHFLVDDTLRYLIRNDAGNGASASNFKRYELTLRSFAPRIELIRREVPINYEPYVLSVLKRVREARSRAVEPLFAS
jgi:hypothetical protein